MHIDLSPKTFSNKKGVDTSSGRGCSNYCVIGRRRRSIHEGSRRTIRARHVLNVLHLLLHRDGVPRDIPFSLSPAYLLTWVLSFVLMISTFLCLPFIQISITFPMICIVSRSCANKARAREGKEKKRQEMSVNSSYKHAMGGKLQLKGDALPTINKTYVEYILRYI